MRKSVSLDSDRDRPIQIPNEFHERRFSRRFRGPRKSFTERRVARARRRRCYRPSRLRGSPPGFGRSWQRQREEREGEDGLALVGPRGRGGRERAFVRSPGDVSPKKKTSLSARDSRRAIRFFTTTCPPSRLAPRTRARSARDSRPIPADAARFGEPIFAKNFWGGAKDSVVAKAPVRQTGPQYNVGASFGLTPPPSPF